MNLFMLSNINDKPPTLYSIMNSIANYGNDNDVKTRQLANVSRETIFDFDYPLTSKVSKEYFETQILNHYIDRRIGFQTFTSFKIHLENKLNEIMPVYNKMFDMLDGWDVFNDGEVTKRITDNTNKLSSNTKTSDISDRKYSETPQNRLKDIQDGKYLTDYNYDVSNGDSTSNSQGDSKTNEIITRTPADKIAQYRDYKENVNSIMSMIYKELDCLFYLLV